MEKLNLKKFDISHIALIIFIASELTYYLLIAQTGIVEHLNSDILQIAPLPIGGVIGSLLTYYLTLSNRNKIVLFLSLQLIMSFFYPDLSFMMLFILGISVGALAPLIINELKKATIVQMGVALGISYSLGTSLFNYDAASRDTLAIILTLVTLLCSIYLPKKTIIHKSYQEYSLFVMVLWIFLDSALFETLSRDITISIWRDGYSFQIALFHIFGVIAAIVYPIGKKQKELFIIILFALSYLFYFLEEAFILAIVYPFVISYYNVTLLQSIMKRDLKTISIYMIFIGWAASGAGLFIALESLILFVPIIFLICLLVVLNSQQTKQKELHYV